MGWLREAISDTDGIADMAYIVIGVLAASAVGTLIFLCVMSVVDYLRCTPIITISNGDTSTRNVIPCRFDPLPLGQSSGLIFAAFTGIIGGLAGYMAATRRQPKKDN